MVRMVESVSEFRIVSAGHDDYKDKINYVKFNYII